MATAMIKLREDEEAMLQGQAEILNYTYNFVESMAIKCVVELGIADIINSAGKPLTLHQIAAGISSHSTDIDHLSRLMRFLVYKNVFEATADPNSEDTLYALTYVSKWLLRNEDQTLAPLVLMATQSHHLTSWQWLSNCIIEGGNGFDKAHGFGLYDIPNEKTDNLRRCFDEAMACTSRIVMQAILSNYRDGFNGVSVVVDVGGGVGIAVADIVKAHPHIRGINFDLPAVVASAPKFPGVTHLGGDMFDAIPHGDAIFMKWIMHNWSDEKCVKILKNCRKAIPESGGKIIIADGVLQPAAQGDCKAMDTFVARYDLTMMVQTSSGKERTEAEWKKLLEDGGFGRHKIIKIPSFMSVIEAYPE